MKKKWIVIISVILVLVLALGTVGFLLFSPPKREFKGRITPPDYSHHAAEYSDGNNLIQISTKLYYSVDPVSNPFDYGIYEISNKGIKRIWWGGLTFDFAAANDHNCLAEYEDQLCEIDPQTGEISLFDFGKKEFVKQDGLYSDYVLRRNEYQAKQTENDSPVLYTNLFGKFYYIVDRNATPVLYLDRAESDEDIMIFDFADLDEQYVACRQIYSMGATLYVEYETDSEVRCLEYYPEREEVVHVSAEDYVGKLAVIGTGVYVNNTYNAENPGIFVTDTKTKEKTQVYEGQVEDWAILDDKWVYFTLEDRSLYRVSLDGYTLEQVF